MENLISARFVIQPSLEVLDPVEIDLTEGMAAILLPIKDRQITLVYPKAHFRRVFEITGMAGDFEVVTAVPSP